MDVTRSGGVRRRRRRRVRDPEISWEHCRPPPSVRLSKWESEGGWGKDQIHVSGSEKRRGEMAAGRERRGQPRPAQPTGEQSGHMPCETL